jgi:hypothetical protein
MSPDTTAAILAERQTTHGDYTDHARITQALKAECEAAPNWPHRLTDDQRETIHMICHKLGRILQGNPEVEDHWADIAGYARLSADRVASRQPK